MHGQGGGQRLWSSVRHLEDSVPLLQSVPLHKLASPCKNFVAAGCELGQPGTARASHVDLLVSQHQGDRPTATLNICKAYQS